jgi:hypothetical protein
MKEVDIMAYLKTKTKNIKYPNEGIMIGCIDQFNNVKILLCGIKSFFNVNEAFEIFINKILNSNINEYQLFYFDMWDMLTGNLDKIYDHSEMNPQSYSLIIEKCNKIRDIIYDIDIDTDRFTYYDDKIITTNIEFSDFEIKFINMFKPT